MKSVEKEHGVIDLRGVKTQEEMRVERLRNKVLSEYHSVKDMENISSLREVERSGATKQSKETWSDVISGIFRVASIVLLVAGSWTYLPTIASSLAYFTDTEAGSAMMTSGFIDLIASSSPAVTELECGGMADPEVYIETDGNPVNVTASTTGITGNVGLCNAMDLDVRLLGETVYSGPLNGFHAEDIEDGTMRFIVSLPDDAGPFPENAECVMNIKYTAVQKRHGGGVGFSDEENIDLAFSVDAESCDDGCDPCSCDCCGDLDVGVTNDNDGTIINDFDISTNTGGNTATSGGTIITGNATSAVSVVNILNVNDTNVENDCDGCTASSSDDVEENDDDEVTEEVNNEDCQSAEVSTEECLHTVTSAEEEEDVSGTTSTEDLSDNISTDMDDLAESIQDSINEHMSGMLGS